MSKRLQVLLEESEMREIRKLARAKRMTVAEWVRQALRFVRDEVPREESARKLAAVRTATRHNFPTGDIAEMLSEIDQEYTLIYMLLT